MKIIRKYFSLSAYERKIILKMIFYLVRAEIVLSILPYPFVRKYVFNQKTIRRTPPLNPVKTLRLHLRYLLKISDLLPWKITCLRKAVALRDALAADGVVSTLKIGIKKENEALAAHAWLECCGQEILNSGSFQELTVLSELTALQLAPLEENTAFINEDN